MVVDNVSGCMCQRTSSLPKTRSRLAKKKTTAMKISHHLYQANCNRVSGPVIVRTLPKNCGSTKTLQLLATTITVNRRMSQSHLMMMHQPSVHVTFEAANESEQSSVLETNESEERRPQRLRRGPVRLTYDVPGQPVYYPAVTTNIHSVSGSTYPAPVSFGLTPPYLPSCHWPQYGLPIQPMYYFCA